MSTDLKHIKDIICANNDNSLAIFIGAGISKCAETKTLKLPNWSELIEEIKKELGEAQENDYPKIAQLYYIEFGEHAYYKKIKQYFPDYISPSLVHKLIFDINPHVIITTNWDTLLERTIEENAFIFDVICSDTDLVKSTLQNKLIKMHGDFKNHNIVFKEDDYISYPHKFPLIENYVRSILSTHSVLFLGYSYNDINLKQILKWIQNHSAVRPPMYLATFKYNATQTQYLKNHGITTLLLEETGAIDGLPDPYANRTHIFLDRIKNHEKHSVSICEDDTDFVLSRIKGLDELEGILFEQIEKALTNCGFIYDSDSKPILEFYKNESTHDYDEGKRLIYQRFIDLLKSMDPDTTPSPHTLKIFEILKKARIKWIRIPNDPSSELLEYITTSNTTEDQESCSSKQLNFDFDPPSKSKGKSEITEMFDLSFALYAVNRTEDAYRTMEDCISICLKQRSYTLLFIAMFNRNVLLRQLKYSFGTSHENYTEVKEYDLKNRFFNLPKDLQRTLEPIYQFVDFSFIYKYWYTVTEELKKIEGHLRTREAGGFVSYNDEYKASIMHQNIVHFVIKNKIMIEIFTEYRSLQSRFIQIALTRQKLHSSTSLNRIELFSCIKYIDNKELRQIFKDFYDKNSSRNGTLCASSEDKEWLINVCLENIVSAFLKEGSRFERGGEYIENIIFMLALINHEQSELAKIFEGIEILIKQGENSIGIVQSINLFLGIQYQLYKTEIDEKIILVLMESAILKIVNKKASFHEYYAYTRNDLSNIYGYARERNAIFKNQKLIERLIAEISHRPINEQIDLSQGLLINLHEISDDDIKALISSYISSINITEGLHAHMRISFQLMNIAHEFKQLTN
jgi:SIR2-like domain